MKNKLIMVLLAIAVFIPSVVAIISYNQTKNAPVSEKNVRTMEIADLAGNTFTFSRDKSSESEMIDFFFALNRDSSKVASLPDPLVGTAFFKVKMASAQQSAEYQYYFSTDTTQAYYQNDKGEAFSIPESYASKFVESRYAVSLYVNAVVPVLSVSDAGGVLPDSASWMYKNSAGVYVECDTSTAAQAQTVSMEGGLELAFTVQPDHFHVKLTDKKDGQVIFNDQYSQIHTLSIDKSVTLGVEIEAKWYEDSARDYYGEMKFAFSADIAAPAEFYLGETEIENGMFTVVSAINIADTSKIQFSSSPDIGYTPVFFQDGEYAVALIPIRCELEAGEYTLTFKYGGVTDDLTLNVTQRNVRNFQYNISAAVLNATRTEKTLADFKTAVSDAVSSGESTQLWEGLFLEIQKKSAYDGVITTGFGHNRKITANGVTYLHEGVDYITASGREIVAPNSGKVVYAGYTELGGNTLIIEHGYGLKSWFCHLSELKLAVGDTVQKGDVVGIAGSSGFTNQTGVHIGLSVFDVPVSPYPSWETEIKITK